MTKYALIQYDIIFGDPEANYKKVKKMIHQAMSEKPDVIVLPELWTTGYDLTRIKEISDQDAKETEYFLSHLAKSYHVNIIGGSIAKKTGENVTNTMLNFNRKGELIHDYSKVHLFRLMDEEKYLVEGHNYGHFELEGVPSASLICYDIRFPEWVRHHAIHGAEVLYVVAEWPKQRLDHWRALLISRAIENQAFVVACNRVGADPKNEFAGHSMIISPWGEIIAEADGSEQILYGDVSIDEVKKVRNTIPVFEDRRPELYGDKK